MLKSGAAAMDCYKEWQEELFLPASEFVVAITAPGGEKQGGRHTEAVASYGMCRAILTLSSYRQVLLN